jgi:hypothetical protein
MIRLFFIPVLIVLSCGLVKTNKSSKDPVIVQSPSSGNAASTTTAMPTCIKNKIDSFKLMQKHEQPQRVTEYMYKGKKVYYIVMPCCDFFSEVYDDKCKFLGSPDGGITGKGDGKLPDFFTEVTKEKLIWEAAK